MTYQVVILARERDGNNVAGKVPVTLGAAVGGRVKVPGLDGEAYVVLNVFPGGHHLEEADLPTWPNACEAPAK